MRLLETKELQLTVEKHALEMTEVQEPEKSQDPQKEGLKGGVLGLDLAKKGLTGKVVKTLDLAQEATVQHIPPTARVA